MFGEKPGCLPITYNMKLNPEIEPVIRDARRIPHGIADKVKFPLEQMESDGIITKVTEPTVGFINGRCQEEKQR